MTPTITVTEEAKEFFARNPDSTFRDLVDRSAREFVDHMGSLPLVIDAIQDADSGRTKVYVAVEIDPAQAEPVRERFHCYMREWLSHNDLETRCALGFAVQYR